MQKSYNPFKMWGSWVGFIIGILLIFFSFLRGFHYVNISYDSFVVIFKILSFLNPFFWLEFAGSCNEAGCGMLTGYSSPFIYFLIGWGIHSLVRKLK